MRGDFMLITPATTTGATGVPTGLVVVSQYGPALDGFSRIEISGLPEEADLTGLEGHLREKLPGDWLPGSPVQGNTVMWRSPGAIMPTYGEPHLDPLRLVGEWLKQHIAVPGRCQVVLVPGQSGRLAVLTPVLPTIAWTADAPVLVYDLPPGLTLTQAERQKLACLLPSIEGIASGHLDDGLQLRLWLDGSRPAADLPGLMQVIEPNLGCAIMEARCLHSDPDAVTQVAIQPLAWPAMPPKNFKDGSDGTFEYGLGAALFVISILWGLIGALTTHDSWAPVVVPAVALGVFASMFIMLGVTSESDRLKAWRQHPLVPPADK